MYLCRQSYCIYTDHAIAKVLFTSVVFVGYEEHILRTSQDILDVFMPCNEDNNIKDQQTNWDVCVWHLQILNASSYASTISSIH